MNRNDKCVCGSGLKYKKCCGKLKPNLSIEDKLKTYKPGFFEEYKLNLNMGYLVACIADSYAMMADSMLGQCGYKLDNSEYFNNIKDDFKKLLKPIDGMPSSNKSDAFLMCVNRAQEVFDAMAKKDISEEEHVRLLSFIQNTFKDGKDQSDDKIEDMEEPDYEPIGK